jgi:Arc/MetJ-type ribon-helix-helix transcriptional regulator
MTIQLPEELERYVRNEVQLGRFASADEAITEAVRLLRLRTVDAPPQAKPLSEAEFAQKLMQSGLLSSVPPRPTPARRDFQPVHIKGEPLSETVIRERR